MLTSLGNEKEMLTECLKVARTAHPSTATQFFLTKHQVTCSTITQQELPLDQMMATALGLEWRCQYNRGVLQSKPLSSHHTCQILSLFPQTPIIINKSSQVNSVPMKNARFTALEIHFLCLQINFLEMMESMDRQAACWRTCSLQTSVKVGSLSCACFPKHSPNGLSTWKRAQEAQNWKACPCLGLVGLARLCELIESSMETEDKTAGETDPQLRLVGSQPSLCSHCSCPLLPPCGCSKFKG